MQKTVLQKKMQRFHKARSAEKYQTIPQLSSGFTLLELLVVVLIIAVLSAIAAPGWLTFLNRQRVSKVNDAIFRSIQNAQREARRTKLSYSVSFRMGDPNPADSDTTKVPQVAIYPTTDLSGAVVNPNIATFKEWKLLRENLDIKPGQIVVSTNIGAANKSIASVIPLTDGARTVTFDYGGKLPDARLGTDGLAIIVAIPKPGTTDPTPSTKRCVIVKTLLGSVQTQQAEKCPS